MDRKGRRQFDRWHSRILRQIPKEGRAFSISDCGISAAWRPGIGRVSNRKFTRIRHYQVSELSRVVAVETDAGITGFAEAGSRYTIEQLAGLVIGENPSRTERLWQLIHRHYFYPPERERIRLLGAIDPALWDISRAQP